MSKVTVETILEEIAQLPPDEQSRLRLLLEDQKPEPAKPAKRPLDPRVPPIPVPDSAREMKWLSENNREYAGQWVALDGDRLIAHGTNHHEVFEAAKADGAYLPLITFVNDPDEIFVNV